MRTTLAALICLAFIAGLAVAKQIPPVKIRLGRVEPTPVPTADVRERVRMVSAFTMQNRPNGDSIITFEATDFGMTEKGDFKVLAAQVYSLLEPKKKLRPMAKEIMQDIRDLEQRLLDYVEIAGPPRTRAPLMELQGSSQRPGG